MFSHITQPLRYAELLLAQFASLSGAVDFEALQERFVQGLAQLSGCELAQLYLLDATHTCLELRAECLNGTLQMREATVLSADDDGGQLLQFALCQNRVVCLGNLSDSLHDTGFLPAQAQPWQSLLCVPLVNPQGSVEGVCLCVSQHDLDLQPFAGSLGALGVSVIGQLQLLQRLRQPAVEPLTMFPGKPGASGYGLIGSSAAMRQTCSLVSKVLHCSYTVLLQGETGTGKEVVARAVHDCGPRRAHAFIVQNCAALPEHLLESELFGYRKGAFTGADTDRIGLFEAADGGTLLLDEVGDMPLPLQAKLLRVLQDGEIRPLGCNTTRRIDVRIICATHRDLSVLVSAGTFREDLYYRLAQFPIELPALREREGDVLELALHFAEKACSFLQRGALRWSDAALDLLHSHSFPGNVRELKGLVERAVLLCEGDELQPEHFALRVETFDGNADLSFRDRLEQIERRLLLDGLRQHDGNQTLAARALGLPRRTLLYRLTRLGIQGADLHG